MKTKLTLLIFSLTALIGNSRAQLLTNANLEEWPAGCPYNTEPDGWLNFSTSLAPDQAGTCAGSILAVQGDSYMNMVWAPDFVEGAKQSFTDLIIGNDYSINFYAANSDGTYADDGTGYVDVYINSTIVFSTPEMPAMSGWASYNFTFTASSVTDTLAFRVRGGEGPSGSVGVDSIYVADLNTGFIQNNFGTELHVYPNPTDRQLAIALGANFEDVSVTLTDLTGKLVRAELFQQTALINVVLEEPAGGYILTIESEDKRAVIRIVKR